MEDCRAKPDERCRKQDFGEARSLRQEQQPGEREAHADGERVGPRPAIGIDSDDRLQQRGGDLEGEGD